MLEGGVDPDVALVADLVTASGILESEGVLDSFGHVSARLAQNPGRFYIPRAMPPGLVTAADVVEVVVNARLGSFFARRLGDAPVILMRGHGNTVVGSSVKQATVRAVYTDINARMQYQALMLSPEITCLDDAELRQNATENFDVDRPWDNFRRRLEKNAWQRSSAGSG
jgi:ribulose-5-phosphate 4-epimerase/fuculose-1-phosphate aldolase